MTSGWGSGRGWGGLLAAARVDSGTVYYVGLAVVIAIMIVAMIAFYRTWAEINEELEPDSPQDLLESFREAHATGEIDDRELERVRNLLATGQEESSVPGLPRPSSREAARPREGATSPAGSDPAEPLPG